mmetsp:Transcript_4533/g.9150  ORF Transcript_4533/g.9150 Transcript_4533/m.9150 type:complete len:329 (+) Transcript_4533:505-1491(+)
MMIHVPDERRVKLVQSLSTVLVVNIELPEVAPGCCPPISLRQGPETGHSLTNRCCKSSFPPHVGNNISVYWSGELPRPVTAAQLLNGFVGRPGKLNRVVNPPPSSVLGTCIGVEGNSGRGCVRNDSHVLLAVLESLPLLNVERIHLDLSLEGAKSLGGGRRRSSPLLVLERCQSWLAHDPAYPPSHFSDGLLTPKHIHELVEGVGWKDELLKLSEELIPQFYKSRVRRSIGGRDCILSSGHLHPIPQHVVFGGSGREGRDWGDLHRLRLHWKVVRDEGSCGTNESRDEMVEGDHVVGKWCSGWEVLFDLKVEEGEVHEIFRGLFSCRL